MRLEKQAGGGNEALVLFCSKRFSLAGFLSGRYFDVLGRTSLSWSGLSEHCRIDSFSALHSRKECSLVTGTTKRSSTQDFQTVPRSGTISAWEALKDEKPISGVKQSDFIVGSQYTFPLFLSSSFYFWITSLIVKLIDSLCKYGRFHSVF